MTEQHRSGDSFKLALQRKLSHKLPGPHLKIEIGIGVRQLAHLALRYPAFVITSDADDVVFDQQLDRAIRIARPVNDVADRTDQIEALGLEESQRRIQTVIFAMNVAEHPDAAQLASIGVVHCHGANVYHISSSIA